MPEEQNKPNFWTTLPGILTGVAAVVTAIGGLILALHPSGSHASPQDKPAAQTEPAPANPEMSAKPLPPPATSGPNPNPQEQQQGPQQEPQQEKHKGIAVITESNGQTLTVDADSLVWAPTITPGELPLKSGQSLSLSKIKAIDVVAVDNVTTTVQVTLTNGQTLKDTLDGGTADLGTAFQGRNDNGPVRVRIGLLRQIVFHR